MRAWWLAVALLGPSAMAKAPDVAVVTDLKGTVLHQHNRGQAWEAAALDDGLALLDLIRTGARSKTEMRFVDRTVLGVGELTRLRISLALFDVNAAPEPVRVALLAGQIDAAVAHGGRPLEVRAPDGGQVRLEPGRRARVRLVDGQLRVEALPADVRFAADPADTLWQAPLDQIVPDGVLAPGSAPPGDIVPGMPQGMDPWDAEAAAAPGETGVEIVLTPENTP